MARKVTTIAGPQPLYYLAIDGTEAQDSAVFGALLEGRGWQNLATTFLKPPSDNPIRLTDPLHDFLSIPMVNTRGKSVAVVCPNGLNGMGNDPFWINYPGKFQSQEAGLVEGRYAATEL
ncbi:MAG TPA: hypothetical protein VN914_02760, partial [Polyangia bacterium]|nr:hypothetical protein [Polyangia bacterium]